ncbi:hypothetical protein [Pseudoalteromonas byunsanensis]|uniref:DUF2946 domain-containing protein n=1 Tax=Pseudoalteromonas byunsanensis TaxID=327939 RepID=A0A1S1N8Y1_9GAMM|nr:hypothetical protein [Pseudoalteromonas byunsanensis]OHU95155.1 hypothetical protein BIW53_10530 [Pseudoalteromonas byunsanensis]
MLKSLSTILVTLSMLIAFTGQVLAYAAMPCDMSLDNHQVMMSMDHSSKMASMDNSNMSSAADCCDTECTCPASVCTSIHYLSSYLLTTPVLYYSEAINRSLPQAPLAISSSLYRPPIFA